MISWQEQNGRTVVQVQASLEGEIASANILVEGYTIELNPQGSQIYTGAFTVALSPKELFKTVVSPTLNCVTVSGLNHSAVIEWRDPLIVSDTPWQRYVQANSWLYSSIPVFALVHGFYVFALIFFTIALVLAVCIEIRKQHPHLIIRTLALLALLVWCVKF